MQQHQQKFIIKIPFDCCIVLIFNFNYDDYKAYLTHMKIFPNHLYREKKTITEITFVYFI